MHIDMGNECFSFSFRFKFWFVFDSLLFFGIQFSYILSFCFFSADCSAVANVHDKCVIWFFFFVFFLPIFCFIIQQSFFFFSFASVRWCDNTLRTGMQLFFCFFLMAKKLKIIVYIQMKCNLVSWNRSFWICFYFFQKIIYSRIWAHRRRLFICNKKCRK